MSRRARTAPLLPREDMREAALFFVVAALCFLAAIAGMTARSAYAAADAWTSQVAGQITVRIKGADADAQRALPAISQVQGVKSARPVTHDEADELLKPWLGAAGIPADLPLPHLIAVEASGANAGKAIADKLKAANFSAIVDDHVAYSSEVKRATDWAGVIALAAVALLGATAAAVIAFATHATLIARRDIVELLHLQGARDSFISSQFEQRFLMLGVQGGAAGALLAFGATAFILFALKQAGTQIWLLPQLSLSLADGLILGLTPLLAGAAAMLAAKVTVMRSLAAMV